MLSKMNDDRMTDGEKLALLRARFSGQLDVYGTRDQRTGAVRQVKSPVTDAVLLDHIHGRRHFGTYLLVGNRTRALACDFDVDDIRPVLDLLEVAKHYALPFHVERSKSKGHHAWLFFPESGVPAAKARQIAMFLLAEIRRPQVEVFPRQDRLDSNTRYGNFIFVPLFGALVPHGRTLFLGAEDLSEPYADQWRFLRGAACIDEAGLDSVLTRRALPSPKTRIRPLGPIHSPHVAPTRGLPPCAQRMLVEGVRSLQRVSCFRLAVHLKGTGLPMEHALAVLYEWARRIRPADGKRILTPGEIQSQTRHAYDRQYRSYGCDDPAIQAFCVPGCPVRNAAPCSTAHDTQRTCTTERKPAMNGTTANRPVKELRVRNLNLAIWENEGTSRDGRPVTRHSITLNKRYQDQQSGEWKDSSSFFPDDLPRLRLLLDKAYEHLLLSDGDSPGPANSSAG